MGIFRAFFLRLAIAIVVWRIVIARCRPPVRIGFMSENHIGIPLTSEGKAIVISTQAARGGIISGRVLTVLVVSLALSIFALVGVLIYFNSLHAPLQ